MFCCPNKIPLTEKVKRLLLLPSWRVGESYTRNLSTYIEECESDASSVSGATKYLTAKHGKGESLLKRIKMVISLDVTDFDSYSTSEGLYEITSFPNRPDVAGPSEEKRTEVQKLGRKKVLSTTHGWLNQSYLGSVFQSQFTPL